MDSLKWLSFSPSPRLFFFPQAVQNLYIKLGGLVIVLGVVHDPELNLELDGRFGTKSPPAGRSGRSSFYGSRSKSKGGSTRSNVGSARSVSSGTGGGGDGSPSPTGSNGSNSTSLLLARQRMFASDDNPLILNPGDKIIQKGDYMLVMAQEQEHADFVKSFNGGATPTPGSGATSSMDQPPVPSMHGGVGNMHGGDADVEGGNETIRTRPASGSNASSVDSKSSDAAGGHTPGGSGRRTSLGKTMATGMKRLSKMAGASTGHQRRVSGGGKALDRLHSHMVQTSSRHTSLHDRLLARHASNMESGNAPRRMRTVSSVGEELTGHIILAGGLDHLEDIVAHLRHVVSRRGQRRTMVLLHPTPPDQALVEMLTASTLEENDADGISDMLGTVLGGGGGGGEERGHLGGEEVEMSHDLLYVQGDPNNKRDLERVGMIRANFIIITTTLQDYLHISSTSDDRVAEGDPDWLADADAVKAAHSVKEFLDSNWAKRPKGLPSHEPSMVVHLTNSEHTSLLDPTEWWPGQRQQHNSAPVFAAGQLYSCELLDKLVPLVYYIPNVMDVIEAMLEGPSALRHMAVPPEYVGKTFQLLFMHLLEQFGIIAVALYLDRTSDVSKAIAQTTHARHSLADKRRRNKNRRWDSRPMSKTKGRKGGLEGMRDDGLQRVSSARRRASTNTRKQKLTTLPVLVTNPDKDMRVSAFGG